MRSSHSPKQPRKRRRSRLLFAEQLESRRLLAIDTHLLLPPLADDTWPGDARATIDLVVTDSQGFPISQIEQGEAFRLQAWTRQLDNFHQTLRGVFAAYADVEFDSSLVSPAGEIAHGTTFVNGLSGDASAGLLDEVGGFRSATGGPEPPDNIIGELLFEVAMTADSLGDVTFSANPAEQAPHHDVLLHGTSDPLAESEVIYGAVQLQVVSTGDLAPTPNRNSDNAFDTSVDGKVTPFDALLVIAEIDCQGAAQTSACTPDQVRLTDVNGDGQTTRTDLLLVLDHFYSRIAQTQSLPASWQNPANPIDVNDDGIMSPLDGLVIRADLKEHGARALETPQHGHSPPPYLDVNGDGFVTKADEGMVWQFVDPFGPEPNPPENPDPPNGELVVIDVETVDLLGEPISQVNVGDDFYLQVHANGPAPPQGGVFAAFTDVTYDRSLASVSGPIEHGELFFELRSGSTDVAGLLDEVGGITDLVPRPGFDTKGVDSGVLFRVRMTADAVGDLTLAANAADLSPAHDIVVFGFNEPIPLAQVGYRETTLAITSVSSDAPLALDDQYAIGEDDELVVPAASGLLANDSDPNGDSLTVSVIEATQSGLLTLAADGSFVYQPRADFFGEDAFTYEVSDSTGLSNRASVSIRVSAVDDDAPVAFPDTYAARIGQPLLISAERGVLANDFDPDGDALTARLADGPLGLSLSSDGSLAWTPPAGFVSEHVDFTYVASDGEHESEAQGRIIIRDLDDEVVVFSLRTTSITGDQITSIAPGEAFFLEGYVEDTRAMPEGVFAAYVDVTFDPNLATAAGPFNFGGDYPNGRSGDVSVSGRLEEVGGFQSASERLGGGEHRLFSILMTADTVGELAFTTDIADAIPEHHVLLLGEFGPVPEDLIRFGATTLNVAPQNHPPVAEADQYSGDEGTVLTVPAASGVLANDSDPDGDSLTVRLVNEPTSGSLALQPDGSFNYTPNAGFVGLDSFLYVADDGEFDSAVTRVDLNIRAPAAGLIAIRLQAVDSEGVAVDEVTVGEEFELRVYTEDLRPDPQGVFAVYTDIEYDPSLVSGVGEIAFGDRFESGQDATHTPGLIDDTGAFTKSLRPIGGGEFFVFSQRFTADEKGQVVFASSAADDLPFHDVLLYGIDHAIDPNDIEFGTVSLVTVPLTDIVFSSFTLRIVPEGEGPTLAFADSLVVPFETDDGLLDVLTNDSAAVTAITAVAGGRGNVSIAADGQSLLYSAPRDFAGNDRFTYTVQDATGNTDEGTVDVRVRSPYQNFAHTTDTDGDGSVAPLDALYGVNELNRAGSRRLKPADATLEGKTVYLDVNGDLRLSPLDVLIIINELNAQSAVVAEGEAALAPAVIAPVSRALSLAELAADPARADAVARPAVEKTLTRRETFFSGSVWEELPLLEDGLLEQLATDRSGTTA